VLENVADRSSWRSCSRCRPSWRRRGAPPLRSIRRLACRRDRSGRWVCREVLVPGRISADVLDAASAWPEGGGDRRRRRRHGRRTLLVRRQAVGQRGGHAAHNSGHWTMEGAVTSQFENTCDRCWTCRWVHRGPALQVASVNVFGGPDGADPAALLPAAWPSRRPCPPLWQERPPGRKLGHVTVCGDEADAVRARAWSAAIALGTPVPDGIDLPAGCCGERARTAGRRRDGELLRPARHAGASTCSGIRHRPRGARRLGPPHPARHAGFGQDAAGRGSGCSSPEPEEPPTCPACWPR